MTHSGWVIFSVQYLKCLLPKTMLIVADMQTVFEKQIHALANAVLTYQITRL